MNWANPSRIYGAINQRQQTADRLVYNENELTRIIAQGALGEIAIIRLAADIILTKPLALPAASYAIVIDGGGRYGLSTESGYAHTELIQFADRSINDILFRNCSFIHTGTALERLISTDGGLYFGLNFENCRLTKIKRIIQTDGSQIRIRSSMFTDVTMSGLALSDVSNIGSAEFDECLFMRCYAFLPSNTIRRIAISDLSGSTRLVCIDAGPPANTSAISLLAFADSSLYGLEITTGLTVGQEITVGTVFATTPVEVTIDSANPTLTVSSTLIKLSVGASCSGNLTLGDGSIDGQQLTIWVAGFTGGGAFTLPNSAANNVRLNTASGAWTPTIRDTMDLVWIASDGNWTEKSRSANS